MLKFRVTNSMRARRAAEAQRKALDEKLQLEWAWKPMAAMMNEKQTDLVYWIPPLYRNNIKTAGARVRRKSTHRTSVNRRSVNSLPYTHLQAQLHASQRKKKLARRRAKLATEVSFEDPTDTESIVRPRRKSRVAKEISVGSIEDPTDTDSITRVRRRSKLGARVSFENATDTDSAVLDSKSEWQDTKDEDIESGIHDETTDYNADDMSLQNVQSIQEEEVRPTGTTMKRRLGEHRRAHRSSMKPKVPPKPDFITKSFEAIDKPKPAPTLIRLLEKVSHIHCPPNPLKMKPIKPELRKINRRGSESKAFAKGKVRRPSVKIYGNAQNRLSGRRSKGDDPNNLENQCVIVSVDNEALKAVPVPKSLPPPKAPPKSSPKAPTKTSHKSLSKSASKTGVKSGSKSTPKCLSKASLKSLPKELQKELPKDFPKATSKLTHDQPFSILKDQQPFGILKDTPVKPDEAEFRNAQLQMILRLLAQLYEEKVNRQDAEIQNMKTRIQTQDKLMKQMAHVVLELKEEISRIKIQFVGHRPEIPANVLNIKVGDN